MKMNLIAFLMTLMLLIAGCAETEIAEQPLTPDISKDACNADTDCICGGADLDGSCFIGNKDYHNEYVDKSVNCADFCTGIAGNLKVRCIGGACVQTFECIEDSDCASGICSGNRCVNKILGAECSADSDCVIAGCSGTLCQSKNKEQMITTCEYKEEYSCYRTEAACGCDSGKCGWAKTEKFDECVQEARKTT